MTRTKSGKSLIPQVRACHKGAIFRVEKIDKIAEKLRLWASLGPFLEALKPR